MNKPSGVPGIRSRLLLTAVCVVAMWGCADQNTYQEPPPPSVDVAQPLQHTVTNYLEETGTTEPVAMVRVRARVKGFLESMKFEAGADVEKDQVLYIIEQREYKAKVAAAEADVDAKEVEVTRAETEFRRQETLRKEDATSESAVVTARADRDAAQAELAASQAALEQAQIDLDYTEVKAAIAGRVGKTAVKVGNLVDGAEATHLTDIYRYDPIYANFNISERSLLAIMDRPNRDAERESRNETKLYLGRANDTGFPFEGVFDYADLAVDQSTGTFLIRAIFPNEDLQIVPGLFVRIRIPLGVEENAILVPEIAIGSDQAGRYVMIVNSEDKVERRDVTVGLKHDKYVVIKSGLQGDERVVVTGLQRARPGLKVDPQTADLPPFKSEMGAAEKPETEKPAAETPAKPAEATPPAAEEESAPDAKPAE